MARPELADAAERLFWVALLGVSVSLIVALSSESTTRYVAVGLLLLNVAGMALSIWLLKREGDRRAQAAAKQQETVLAAISQLAAMYEARQPVGGHIHIEGNVGNQVRPLSSLSSSRTASMPRSWC